ncbi:hypothetical protein RB6454 [Rhodopirellula baltica SH 1]|uniref:Uncharacterized protein n=1 Tax=Rhodopirellula baltica (strain DSM 10527 / NCIMB 13988 / SH1) TaxID=243090 RepID=Q7UQ92_RHOBA|nr:hypothetical protein RB6454 [Rhodopirellula baltica SH 1]
MVGLLTPDANSQTLAFSSVTDNSDQRQWHKRNVCLEVAKSATSHRIQRPGRLGISPKFPVPSDPRFGTPAPRNVAGSIPTSHPIVNPIRLPGF